MEDGLDVPEVSSGLNIFFFFFLSYLPTGELRGNYFHDKEIFHRFFFFFNREPSQNSRAGYLLNDKVGFPRREWQVEVNSGWILLAKDLSEIVSLN